MSLIERRPTVWRATVLLLVMSLMLLLSLQLSGCASGPPPAVVDRPETTAIELSTDTALGHIATQSTPAPELSGFRLMPLGGFSLDTRVQLARRAEASLDVQYYHFELDGTGRWLLRALREAALRGVRVRLLLDDLYTSGHDDLWLAFAATPNVEVRLFNPFCCARTQGQLMRFLAAPSQWERLNHRMHNKLFIADGAMAVVGGRNVADEYFLRGSTGNFIDVDAFTAGFIVPPLQALFDRYWNADVVQPLQAVAHSDLDAAGLQARLDQALSTANTPAPGPLPPNDVLGYGPISEDLDGGRLGLIWADAYAFADHPDKPFEGKAGGDLADTSVTYNVVAEMLKAKQEVVASSPYFVPGERGMGLLRKLRDKGAKVVVMTNSLAATDEPVVHLGYSQYRFDMLGLGVDLYEISPSRVKQNRRPFLFGASLGRLHAKLVVVDRKTSFIGSMNLDPRSATLNTELGVVVHSSALAKELLRVIDIDRLQSTYRVRKTSDGAGVEWLGFEDEREVVLTEEPDTTAWQRWRLHLLRPFVPEEQL